uniref:MULE transposase domain-containing protein n=1 Tax=Lactuca sativa TaxID=4236 RepID=A0A9R1VXQ0_LACSA|nr:hypothetical protein LSAT_V11C400218280 [Lactuca sativa]
MSLAFAILENESYDKYKCISLIYYCHIGILKLFNEHGSPWLELGGFHKYCLWHFIKNFYEKFPNSKLKALAYRAETQNVPSQKL